MAWADGSDGTALGHNGAGAAHYGLEMDQLTRDAVIALERQGWDALCRSTGGQFYGDLMTPEGLMILVNGAVLDRGAVVSSLSDAPAWDRYELADERLVPLGAGTVALVYRASAFRGEQAPFDAIMTSTYVLVDGAPRLALYQQTMAAR